MQANRLASSEILHRLGSMTPAVATADRIEEATFASAGELREVLTALLERIEADPDLAWRLGTAGISFRYVFTDLDTILDVSSSATGEDGISWSFSGDPEREPAVTLEMSSTVANRYLQGRENLAIGMARKRIRCHCDARAALKLLSVSRSPSASYREVIERHYPHLLLD
jgi:hypothetical protein